MVWAFVATSWYGSTESSSRTENIVKKDDKITRFSSRTSSSPKLSNHSEMAWLVTSSSRNSVVGPCLHLLSSSQYTQAQTTKCPRHSLTRQLMRTKSSLRTIGLASSLIAKEPPVTTATSIRKWTRSSR